MVPDFLTIAEAARLIERKELSPIELVESRLDRIARLDGRLNSFIRVLAEEARAEARAAEAEIAADRYRGPLHGIPIGLKDIYETAGVATTGHSKVMQHHVPQKDAFSVQRLREAGAIVVGKLATHEFALGGPSFDLPWPPARNPWDLSRFTGGSSSGTDRKSTRLNSSHMSISYAVFCLKKKNRYRRPDSRDGVQNWKALRNTPPLRP